MSLPQWGELPWSRHSIWELAEEGERAVAEKSVVVHANADDFITEPDGASGARIGCGVIEWREET